MRLDLSTVQKRRKQKCDVERLREELRSLLDDALEECEDYGYECGRAEAEGGGCLYNCHYEKSYELVDQVIELLRELGCL